MDTSATIKLFLPFGDGKRLRTAEISNWTGKAIAAPRSDLDHLLSRNELHSPGIYYLFGIDPLNGSRMAYIGEAEDVSERLKQHKSKEFWNSAITFVSKDENLTKAHIKYLEGRSINIAKEIGRYNLENSQSSGAVLPESDQSDMEVFLERISQLLPVLGSELLSPIVASGTSKKKPTFFCKMKGASATGDVTPNGFVVYKGSTAVVEERASALKNGPWTIKLRDKLKEEGTLVEQDNFLLFIKDTEFSSPSAAAAVIHGGNAAGPLAWKDKGGKTLKEREESSN